MASLRRLATRSKERLRAPESNPYLAPRLGASFPPGRVFCRDVGLSAPLARVTPQGPLPRGHAKRMRHGAALGDRPERPYADPEKAARKLVEIANATEAVHDGRIYIELINGPFLYEHKGSPAEYKAGLEVAIRRGWLVLHESGTYAKFTQQGAELFA
jgi:hypothetical protein